MLFVDMCINVKYYTLLHNYYVDGKYSEKVQLPAKAKFVLLSATLGNTCHTYY